MNTKTAKKRTGRIVSAAVLTLVCLISYLCFFAVIFYTDVYGDTGFDSVLYTLFGGMGGTQSGLVATFITKAVIPTVLCTALTAFLMFAPKRIKWLPARKLCRVISMVLCIVLVCWSAVNVGLVQYVHGMLQLTELYENEYVDPNTVQITFPEEKRNLIYIYLESMETSYLSTEQGGAMQTCLIPELYELASTYTNFSHSDGIGGLVEVPGASWTVGAMVAQTAGVPLITPSDVSDWQNGYGKEGVFLPGLTSINNILRDAGYYQALMVGSSASFGGRSTYFSTHQVDKIYDLYTARKDGIVPKDYFVWWGMEDLHLFEYAKQELLKLAEMDQPFAFTTLTVDTHHIGGYTCALCGSTYEESYENAIACSSAQVYAFVEWIMEQDFYENTTVIITGDHFSMDSGYFSRAVEDGYVRHGYNCFINSAVEASSTTNRQFSSLDMFPTTLAALGCTIEGDKLGFGVNLFSDRATMIEEFGYSAFCTELGKRTEYYSTHFYTAEEE